MDDVGVVVVGDVVGVVVVVGFVVGGVSGE